MFTSSIGAALQTYFPLQKSTAVALSVGSLVSKYCFNKSWTLSLLVGCAFQVVTKLAGECLRGTPKLEDQTEDDSDLDIFDRISRGPSAASSAQGSPHMSPQLPPLQGASFTPPPPLVLESPPTSPLSGSTSPAESDSSGSDHEGITSLFFNGKVVVEDGRTVTSPIPFQDPPHVKLGPNQPLSLQWGSFARPSPRRTSVVHAGSLYKRAGEHGW